MGIYQYSLSVLLFSAISLAQSRFPFDFPNSSPGARIQQFLIADRRPFTDRVPSQFTGPNSRQNPDINSITSQFPGLDTSLFQFSSLDTRQFFGMDMRLFSVPETNQHPVCVVGAGISGLNLGILLSAKGYRVELFEEKGRVGGKAATYREGDSVIIDKCPLFFSPTERSLMAYIERYQLETVPFNQSDRVPFDPESGSIQALPALTKEVEARIADALRRYVVYHNGYKNDLDVGYLNASPDLYLPFSTWAGARNLSVLVPLFAIPVTIEGYGHLDDLPAIYVLHFITPDKLSLLISSGMGQSREFLTVKNGLSTLVNRMAESLTVHLNHKVASVVRRYPGLQEIGFENPDLPVRQCQKVILAFPPLLKNLERIVADLSTTEREVLSQVKVNKYTSSGQHLPPLDHSFYYEGIRHRDLVQAPVPIPSPVGNGEVVSLLKQSNGGLKNVYSGYSWIRGSFDTVATPEDMQIIRRNLENFLKKISPNPEIFFLEATEYSPHVTTSSLQDGFYRKFERLQGNNGLYYATTLLTFETMNSALRMTEALVNRYF